MIDFAKLRDPAYQEARRLEREAEAARQEEHDKTLRAAVDDCLEAHYLLSETERSVVRNCRMKLNTYGSPSEKQEKWLLDIAKRVRVEVPTRIAKLIETHANGDAAGEHPNYPRCDWPFGSLADVDPSKYWQWVLQEIEEARMLDRVNTPAAPGPND